MIEGEPVDLKEYAIAKQRALVVSLRSQLIREEGVLNQLLAPRPPITHGRRPEWKEFLEVITREKEWNDLEI